MGRIFQREIKANIQANASMLAQLNGAESALNTGKETSVINSGVRIKKYELIDKGPDFMRCAIKTSELKNILILSLPDNMLGLEDARMLSEMIKKNTPLKVLNLNQN